MQVEATPSFNRDISKIKDAALAHKITLAINKMLQAENVSGISGIKKLAGSSNAYRLRIGDYRLGFILIGGVIRLIIFAHRREIYRDFP